MKSLFDTVSFDCSKIVTKSYSTSFAGAVKMLAPSIRQDIYNIYGFVRLADEIVDSFHDYNKQELFERFETDLKAALTDRISLNPILNSFQNTVYKHQIPHNLIEAFMSSMKQDLIKNFYTTKEEYEDYIYGSADVVGLMCLKVFVKVIQNHMKTKAFGNAIGICFSKGKFLRDLKADYEDLNRTYFPNTDLKNLNEEAKNRIIKEIESDFAAGFQGIKNLPIEAKFGVYTAYIYYKKLLSKLKKHLQQKLKTPEYEYGLPKMGLLANCYLKYRLNLL